jgi:hypothetical protein
MSDTQNPENPPQNPPVVPAAPVPQQTVPQSAPPVRTPMMAPQQLAPSLTPSFTPIPAPAAPYPYQPIEYRSFRARALSRKNPRTQAQLQAGRAVKEIPQSTFRADMERTHGIGAKK